jgi:C_GCAxxG_C_C family probable redox protein
MDQKERDNLIEKAYELGFRYEREHRGCAQCAVKGIQDALGIVNDHVYKAASGLAGGGGECTDGVCGGYSGASMMISLLFGRTLEEAATEKGRADKYQSFYMTAALHDKYMKKYGSVLCKDIQKKMFGRSFDLRNDTEKQEFRDAGAHHDDDKCCMAVGDGARWGCELILAEMEKRGLTPADFAEITSPKA